MPRIRLMGKDLLNDEKTGELVELLLLKRRTKCWVRQAEGIARCYPVHLQADMLTLMSTLIWTKGGRPEWRWTVPQCAVMWLARLAPSRKIGGFGSIQCGSPRD
jgi:hypothetical protein